MHATPATAPAPALRGWRRAAVWAVALVAMAGVFALYVQPDFMVLMANQVWACF
jgi:hypothetical protein